MSKNLFISGNEAIALSAFDHGVQVATGYPGTPSTEILEHIKKLGKIDASWCPNEKVALEVAIGSSFVGGRSIVTMKHVGLNVAADPLMTLSYTGVKGALVIITCDDPGMFSSQNEQDNRNYAKFAKIPMLEPSDSNEAYYLLREALSLSERFDTPVLFRLTTRVCHAKSEVERTPIPLTALPTGFEKGWDKFVMLPKQGRERHQFVEERLIRLAEYNDVFRGNWIEINTKDYESHESKETQPKTEEKKLKKKEIKKSLAIVTSGVSYHYVKELNLGLPIIKLSFTYPLPKRWLKDKLGIFNQLICMEELDPFLEQELINLGFAVIAKSKSFYLGEYSTDRVRNLLTGRIERDDPFPDATYQTSPPALCSGCPHLTIFNVFRNLGLNVSGDIGCYTLAALKPFESLHTVVEMGASIPMATGMKKILGQKEKKKTVAVIGDSTFFHSGLTGLIDAVQQGVGGVVFILDNSATAMTGRQGHAGTGKPLIGDDRPAVDYEKLLQAIGIKHITFLDPYLFSNVEKKVEEILAGEGLRVVILKRECALIPQQNPGPKVQVMDNCVKCGDCLQVGCPSISFNEEIGHPLVDQSNCIGCGICQEVCGHDAILPVLPNSISKKSKNK